MLLFLFTQPETSARGMVMAAVRAHLISINLMLQPPQRNAQRFVSIIAANTLKLTTTTDQETHQFSAWPIFKYAVFKHTRL